MCVMKQFQELEGEAEGYIAFKQPWPGIMRTVYGDHERFEKTYFQRYCYLKLNITWTLLFIIKMVLPFKN